MQNIAPEQSGHCFELTEPPIIWFLTNMHIAMSPMCKIAFVFSLWFSVVKEYERCIDSFAVERLVEGNAGEASKFQLMIMSPLG